MNSDKDSKKKILEKTIMISLVLFFLLLFPALAGAESYREYINTPVNPDSISSSGNLLTDLNSGAATFSYDLTVPPGTNGLRPVLKLSYNSHQKNSYPELTGSGWSLTQNYIQRNAEHTPNNDQDDTDILFFNGQTFELFYDEVDQRYHTNPESFMSIKAYRGGNGQQQIYAVLTTKDGTEYRFGHNRDSEMYSNQHQYGRRWYLDQVEDTHGNKIFYTYREDPYPGDLGVTYLDRIEYNNDRQRQISFSYEPLPRSWAVFEDGHKFKRTHRLNEIRIMANNDQVRKYGLAYTTNDLQTRSYLSSITGYGSNNAALPATRFSYYPLNKGWERDQQLEAELPDLWFAWENMDDGTRVTDLNRDGKTDFLTNSEGGFSGRNAYLNYGTDFRRQGNFLPPEDANFIYEDDGIFYDNGVRLGDYNGDGREDLIQTDQIWENTGERWHAVNQRFPAGFTGRERILEEFTRIDLGVRLADLNGDRFVDALKATQREQGMSWINTGNADNGWVPAENWLVPHDLRFVDSFGRDLGLRLADINGDGLVDLYHGSNREEAQLWLNTGGGWARDVEWNLANLEDTIWGIGEDNGVRISDINGDGLPDMVVAKGMFRAAFMNVGEGWELDPAWHTPDTAEFVDRHGENEGTRLFDITGDGAVDVVTMKTGLDENSIKRIWKNSASQQSLLREVQLPEGGVYTITYENSGAGDDGGRTDDMGFTLWVVDSVTHRDFGVHHTAGNRDGTTSASYYYTGGKYDFVNDKFLGFDTVEEMLPDETLIKHYYEQEGGKEGKEYRTDTYDSNGNLLRTKEYAWNSVRNRGRGSHDYYTHTLTQEQQTDYLPLDMQNRKIKRISYTYDDYGNVIEIHHQGDLAVNDDDYYEQFTYGYNLDDWIVDRLKNYKKVKADHRTIFSEAWNYYDNHQDNNAVPARGDLTKNTVWLDGGDNPEVTYTYTNQGNLREVVDARGNAVTYTYDPTGTFIITATNALGHEFEWEYDLGTGNLLSYRDPNDYETTYVYDAFGRKIKEIREGDTVHFPTKEWTYHFDGVVPEKITERSKINEGVYTESISFYDGFGYKIQQRKKRDNGNQIVNDYYYDSSERINGLSNPYETPYTAVYSAPSENRWQSQLKTQYPRDTFGRVITIVRPDDIPTRIVYGIREVTIIDGNNHQKKYYHGAFGRVIRIEEFIAGRARATTYRYDLDNTILEIEDAQGNSFSFRYDSLGRLQEIDDPDRGVWGYEYDENGNLISQTDANDNHVSIIYDELNRMREKRVGNQVIAYTYDRDTIGSITRITTPDMSITYSYDERLRPIGEIKTISGMEFQLEHAYDGLNRLTQELVRADDPEEITFEYGLEGLSELNDLVTITYHEFGYPARRTYANGLTTDRGIDVRRQTPTSLRTGNKQDLRYTYDHARNIQTVDDRHQQQVITLVYDEVNRLTHAQKRGNNDNNRNTNFAAVYSYDAIGNMLTTSMNNERYTFSYQNSPVHAPSMVNAPRSLAQCEPHERLFGFVCLPDGNDNEHEEPPDEGNDLEIQHACEQDNECQDNEHCVDRMCVNREQDPVEEDEIEGEGNEGEEANNNSPLACRQDSQCERGFVCVRNKCISKSEQDLDLLPDLTIPRLLLLNPEKVQQDEEAVYEMTIQNIGDTIAEQISWIVFNLETGEELAKSGDHPINRINNERKVIIYPKFMHPCKTIRAEVDYLKNITEYNEQNNHKDEVYQGGLCKGDQTDEKRKKEEIETREKKKNKEREEEQKNKIKKQDDKKTNENKKDKKEK